MKVLKVHMEPLNSGMFTHSKCFYYFRVFHNCASSVFIVFYLLGGFFYICPLFPGFSLLACPKGNAVQYKLKTEEQLSLMFIFQMQFQIASITWIQSTTYHPFPKNQPFGWKRFENTIVPSTMFLLTPWGDKSVGYSLYNWSIFKLYREIAFSAI